MKIVFITVSAPFGKRESFITTELKQISLYEKNLFIFPLLRPKNTISDKSLVKFVLSRSRAKAIAVFFGQFIRKMIPIGKILLRLSRTQKIKRFFYTLFFLPRTLLLVDWIEKEQIDHLHAYWGTSTATCALITNYLTGVHFSFSIHRADIETNDVLEFKASKAKFIRSISEWGKDKAESLEIPRSKIFVIHLGVNVLDILPIRIKNQIIELVAVANLIKLKRVAFLVEEIAKIPNLRLNIIGEGPEKRKIQKIVRKNKICNRINFLGHLTSNELFFLYKDRRFDLFVLPSSIEGIPVSAMEAMANCIPVAITKVGGSGELVNSKNGYILKQDFSNLEKILSRCPEPSKITNAYNKVKKEFNVSRTSLKLLNTIRNYVEQ